MTDLLLTVVGVVCLLVVVAIGALALTGQQLRIAEQPDPLVDADDALVEQLRAGAPPDLAGLDDDEELFVRLLAAWRDDAQPDPEQPPVRELLARWDRGEA